MHVLTKSLPVKSYILYTIKTYDAQLQSLFSIISFIPDNLKGLSSPVSEIMIMTYQNRKFFKTGSNVIKT